MAFSQKEARKLVRRETLVLPAVIQFCSRWNSRPLPRQVNTRTASSDYQAHLRLLFALRLPRACDVIKLDLGRNPFAHFAPHTCVPIVWFARHPRHLRLRSKPQLAGFAMPNRVCHAIIPRLDERVKFIEDYVSATPLYLTVDTYTLTNRVPDRVAVPAFYTDVTYADVTYADVTYVGVTCGGVVAGWIDRPA